MIRTVYAGSGTLLLKLAWCKQNLNSGTITIYKTFLILNHTVGAEAKKVNLLRIAAVPMGLIPNGGIFENILHVLV